MIYLFLLTIIFFTCLIGIIWGLKVTGFGRILQLPFIYGVTLLWYVFPQAAISAFSKSVPIEAYIILTIQIAICSFAVYLGYFLYIPEKRKSKCLDYHPQKIFLAGAVCLGISLFFYIMLRTLPQNLTSGVLWTGLPVYYYYGYLNFGIPAMILLCISAFKLKTKSSYLLAILSILPPLINFFIFYKRTLLFFVLLIVFTAFYFFGKKEIKFSKKKFIALLVIAMIIASIIFLFLPIFRDKSKTFSERISIPNINLWIDHGLDQEFKESAISMTAVYKDGRYGLGVGFVNSIIKEFVPGSLIGKDLKEKMYLSKPLRLDYSRALYYGDSTGIYIQEYGFADAFYEFGFFASILFLIIAMAFKKMFHGIEQGNVTLKIFYCFFIIVATELITTQLTHIFANHIPIIIILLSTLFYARRYDE